MEAPDGRISHAEILIGDSTLMLADEHPEIGAKSPEAWGGSPVSLMLYVENVDQVFAQAVEAGATVERPLADQFYGDRTGGLKDPFGHAWYVATHIEDVSPEEMARRAKARQQ
jgi:PhnB protein